MVEMVDRDRLARVFADYPWLVDALQEAEYWPQDDGRLRFQARFEDFGPETQEGLRALADALRLEVRELPPSAEPMRPTPEEPPMSYEELRRLRSTG